MEVQGCFQFRLTRNSELFVDDEEVDDLKRAVEGELLSRHYGELVRLEMSDDADEASVNYLSNHFKLTKEHVYMVNGPVNMNRILEVYDLIDRPDLKFPPFIARVPKEITSKSNIFAAIRKRDILLLHPFESFSPVIDFLRQAAIDPDVLAIKQTLYRTGSESVVVDALVQAAKNSKEVTVIIELRARFDEAENIKLATRLQEAGAHVVYGVVGYKTHAKLISILRREGKKLRYYIHLGTGNYHSKTARLYTDYGLFTCDKVIGEDITKVFRELTSLGKVATLNKILHAPFTLHQELIKKIKREAKNAEDGKPARIIAKMNSLVEPQIIRALYEASSEGVKIHLIVRGICCLRPGVKDLSENIQVRSIVGRFLEHTRVYYFENGGDPEIYCASADWMDRNFFRRVEVCFPIEQKPLRERIKKELDYYLRDNMQAWELQPDGSYIRLATQGKTRFSAQLGLLETITNPY